MTPGSPQPPPFLSGFQGFSNRKNAAPGAVIPTGCAPQSLAWRRQVRGRSWGPPGGTRTGRPGTRVREKHAWAGRSGGAAPRPFLCKPWDTMRLCFLIQGGRICSFKMCLHCRKMKTREELISIYFVFFLHHCFLKATDNVWWEGEC